MAISHDDRHKIIHFVSNMKRSGRNTITSLEYFMENLTTKEDVREVIDEVLKATKKGRDLEECLHEYEIFNDLQYAIIANSDDKNKAYKKILVYGNENALINALYVKSFSLLLLGLSFVYYIWYMITDKFLLNMIGNFSKLAKNGKIDMHPYVQIILDIYQFFYPLAIVFLGLYLLWITFYFYSYKNDLELHYKVFNFRALKDSELYLGLIKDMLEAGTKSTKVFEILASYMYPESSRDIWEEINEAKKNNNKKEVIEGFRRLNLNDFTLYVIESGQESQEVKRGLLEAYESVKEFVEIEEKKMVDRIKDIWFYPVVLSIIGLLSFLLFITIDIGFVS